MLFGFREDSGTDIATVHNQKLRTYYGVPNKQPGRLLIFNIFGMAGHSYLGNFFSFCQVGLLSTSDTNYCTLVFYLD